MKYGLVRPLFSVKSPNFSAWRATSSSTKLFWAGVSMDDPGDASGPTHPWDPVDPTDGACRVTARCARSFHDLDAEAVARLDCVDALLAVRRHHATEHRVHAVQVRGGGVGDEELAAAGVRAGVGHAEGAGRVFLGVRRAELALDLVAGAAGAGDALGAVLAVGAAALDHEVVDHAVEGQLVVEALLRQLDEVLHRVGGGLVEQRDFDVAAGGMEDGGGHGWSVGGTRML